jgi:beta-lactamase regulating signal transducer with metallopeptidase domain
MFETIFIDVLNMSYIGSIVIWVVLLARLLLKKAPKKYTYILWSVVLLRLIFPFSFNSALNLLPFNPNPIPADLSLTPTPQIITGISTVDVPINNALPTPEIVASVNPLQIIISIGVIIWIIGILALLIYGISSYLKLKHHLKSAILEKDNIYISSTILTPFVLGLIKPKIYLPVNLDDAEKKHILLHEQTHIKRFDHVIRFISYFVLAIHWFNPLVWVAFYLSGNDMEMACDEAVINQLGYEIKKNYSQSLLNLATGKQNLRISPLAFGEGNPKRRIKNILNLKKPTFYVIVIVVILLAATMIGLITNPFDDSPWLTANEIVNTFEAHDLALEKDNNKNPSDYALQGVEPGIFQFKEYDGSLYIYIFDDLNERKDKINHWEFAESDKIEFDEWITTYASKNASILLEASSFGDGKILDYNVYTKYNNLASSISDTVFLYLNDGKTVVYNGQNEHWRGTYRIKYYNNPITDKNGILHMDTDSWHTSQLTYTSDNPENIGDISYEYNSGGSGNGLRINDEGIVYLGGSSGGGSSLPSEVTITVMWNGQEETLILKPETSQNN